MGLFWRGLAQAWIDAKSRDLAEQDFGERDGDRPKGEDHELHAAGQVCAYCGRVISASQPARLVGENDWAHKDCHKPRN
jgi:hypothetical protein